MPHKGSIDKTELSLGRFKKINILCETLKKAEIKIHSYKNGTFGF